jgi:peptidoglycan/LPS O-acetylase OafA/YrhL
MLVRKKYEIIDFLKGYSIFTIMIFHYLDFIKLPSPFNKVVFFGGSGVHLFVLLSGFGLYLSHSSKKLNYLNFLKRRLSKIYIPYIIIVTLSAFISFFLNIYDNSFYSYFGHVFLYKMFDESIISSYGFQLWFISMILQFYFTFHLIIYLKNKLNSNTIFFFLCVTISLLWSTSVFLLDKGNERIWNSFFLQYLWEFALGIILADKISKNSSFYGKESKLPTLLFFSIINIGIYGFLALKGGEIGKLFNDIFSLIGYSLLAIFIYKLNLKMINSFFLFLGNISMSVYLLHIIVLFIIKALLPTSETILIVIISLTLIVPLSVVYNKFINLIYKSIKI